MTNQTDRDGTEYALTGIIKDVFEASVLWGATSLRGKMTLGIDDRERLAEICFASLATGVDDLATIRKTGFDAEALWEAYQAEDARNQTDKFYDSPQFSACDAYADAAYEWVKTDAGMLAVLRYDGQRSFVIDLPEAWEHSDDLPVDQKEFLDLLVRRGHCEIVDVVSA